MGIDTTGLKFARFLTDERVVIYNTTDKDLDGQVCTVLGRSGVIPASDFYIILLERPITDQHGNTQKAISITEHCLRPA